MGTDGTPLYGARCRRLVGGKPSVPETTYQIFLDRSISQWEVENILYHRTGDQPQREITSNTCGNSDGF